MAITYKVVNGKVEEYDDTKPTRVFNKEDVNEALEQINMEIGNLTVQKNALESDLAKIVELQK